MLRPAFESALAVHLVVIFLTGRTSSSSFCRCYLDQKSLVHSHAIPDALLFNLDDLGSILCCSSSSIPSAPSGATDAVLKPSDPVPEGAIPVKGLDFNEFAGRNITVPELVGNMATMGFQASSIGQAVQIWIPRFCGCAKMSRKE